MLYRKWLRSRLEREWKDIRDDLRAAWLGASAKNPLALVISIVVSAIVVVAYFVGLLRIACESLAS